MRVVTLLLQHKLRNVVHSVLLLGGMAMLLALVGYLLGGAVLMLWLLLLSIPTLIMAPAMSPRMVLGLYGASELSWSDAPKLYEVMQVVAQRAGLRTTPRLFYIPTRVMNAVSVGHGDSAVIAMTDGLLRQLNLRELAGVLGHEISHIKNNDMWVMGLADFISRTTNLLSLLGQFMVIVSIPLMLFTDVRISFLALILLLFAPTVSALMQLALSRTREYDADLEAARLTGDPRGLAAALAKLEYHDRHFFQRIFLPSRQPQPSVLRSHPHTETRIKRLLELDAHKSQYYIPPESVFELPRKYATVTRHPGRRFFTGLWH